MTNIEEKIKEFDKNFNHIKETGAHYYNPWIPDVKAFLRSALQQQAKEFRKIVEGKKVSHKGIDPLIRALTVGYNQALQDLLKELKP